MGEIDPKSFEAARLAAREAIKDTIGKPIDATPVLVRAAILAFIEAEREAGRRMMADSIEQEVRQWAQAYPLKAFPEPDFDEVRRLLGDSLLTRVSASNMRHVITKVAAMFDASPDAGGERG